MSLTLPDQIPAWIWPLLNNPQIRLALLLFGVAGLLAFALPGGSKTDRNGKALPSFRTRPPFRFPWRRKPVIPLSLGPVVIDLQPTQTDTIHVVVGGISGTGKSTLVMPLFDMPIGILVVALDNTRPIAKKVRSLSDGIEWSNEEDSPGYGVGLDLLSGRARTASEVLIAGWTKSSSDTGKYRDIAGNRLWTKIDDLDSRGVRRNFPDLISALNLKTNNPEADRACQDWAGRLERLLKTLGPSLGDELDLIDAMRRQKKVLLRLNRFTDPRIAPMLGGMLLVHARLIAQNAGVPFILIIEEAGQMEQYAEHLSPIAQAGRDRGTPEIILTQNMSKLPLEVVNNVSVWVSFAQEAKPELNFAAERLRLDPTQLQREAFPNQGRGWAYVRAPGISTTLVHLKQQKPSPLSVTPHPQPTTEGVRRGHGIEIRELPVNQETVDALPALPPPGGEYLSLMENIYLDGECERWKGKHDRAGHKQGCKADCAVRSHARTGHVVGCPSDCTIEEHLFNCYALVWWPLAEPTETRTHEWQRVHRVRYRMAYGPIPLDPATGKPLTIDHRRVCPKDCSKLGHLNGPVTRGENVRRSWRTGDRQRVST